jgi:glycosyltransferase involved in cell wall biosynthesis
MVGRPKPLGIAFLAPTPPPVMGPSIATRIVLDGPLPADLRIHHIDTADRRALDTLGRIDAANVWNAIRTSARLLWTLLVRRPRLVYVPISQTPLGYARDSLYLVLAWLFRARVAIHLRGGDFRVFYDGCGRALRAWIRFSLRRVDAVIVLGDCLRPLFTPFVPAGRIHVVPNGEDFPELEGCRRDYADRGMHVVYLGTLMSVKGVDDLLRAAPLVLARHPGARFTLAGEWCGDGFRAWAEAFVRERGIGDRVRFAGPVDRAGKVALLRDADLFVLPSTREGHPWAIVEALAAGLPIVSCDTGCVRESVLDGRNGRLVAMRAPEELARAIGDMLSAPDRLARMSRESRVHYAARFTRDHFRTGLFDARGVAAGRRARGEAAAEPPCA